MGGNVNQWNEALISGSFRGVRGGEFDSLSSDLLSSYRYPLVAPLAGYNGVGFRMAMVPEPSTGVLALVACGMMLWWRKRFR
jgi:formylglycine-generating enzyme required for sulfatase activity